MDSMFKDAKSFNKDISTWNVSKIDVMANIFNGATNFNQDLSS